MHGDVVFYGSGPFSQWTKCSLTLDGTAFNCAEQAMMFYQLQLFEEAIATQQIAQAQDTGKQKALGRSVNGFDETTWAAHRKTIDDRIDYAKSDQNKALRRKPFQTQGRVLAEASRVDAIWGIGLDAAAAKQTHPSQWPRQNSLGQWLMQVRNDLATKYPDAFLQVGKDTIL